MSQQQRTDRDGKAIFDNLKSTKYNMTAEDGSLNPDNFTIVNNQDVTVETIYTGSGPGPTPGTTYKATITLKNTTNQPVTNKEVKVQLGSGTPITGTTDATNGQVVFTGLSAGTYTVSVAGGSVTPSSFIISNADVSVTIIYDNTRPSTGNYGGYFIVVLARDSEIYWGNDNKIVIDKDTPKEKVSTITNGCGAYFTGLTSGVHTIAPYQDSGFFGQQTFTVPDLTQYQYPTRPIDTSKIQFSTIIEYSVSSRPEYTVDDTSLILIYLNDKSTGDPISGSKITLTDVNDQSKTFISGDTNASGQTYFGLTGTKPPKGSYYINTSTATDPTTIQPYIVGYLDTRVQIHISE